MLDFAYNLFSALPDYVKAGAVKLINFFFKIRLRLVRTPLFIIFFVTGRCNANCRHCFYRPALNRRQQEITLPQAEKIAVSLKNRTSLLLTGGEPFLRDDLLQICRAFYCRGKTKDIRIATNGFFTDKIISTARDILKDNKARLTLQVSVDAIGDVHEALRQLKGAYLKAMETIAGLKRLALSFPRLRISVVSVVTEYNYHELAKLAAHLKDNFSLNLGLIFIRDDGAGVYNLVPQLRCDIPLLPEAFKLPARDKIEALISRINRLSEGSPRSFKENFSQLEKKYELDIIFDAKRPPVRCLAPKTDLVIYPDGKTAFCEIVKPFADLKEFGYDISKLWNSQEAKETRKKNIDCFCAHPCHLISSMRNNARTLLDLGKFPVR
jgi:MoaA/NifB/PqqE/SkfB family radical SAM enzyme